MTLFYLVGSEGVRGWGLINGLVLQEASPVLAGAVVAETTELGLLLVPAGLKVCFGVVNSSTYLLL